jgi:hypothetical protein
LASELHLKNSHPTTANNVLAERPARCRVKILQSSPSTTCVAAAGSQLAPKEEASSGSPIVAASPGKTDYSYNEAKNFYFILLHAAQKIGTLYYMLTTQLS